MAEEERCARQRWPFAAAFVVLVATVMMLTSVHGLISTVSERSRVESRTPAKRVSDARLALRLEPYNSRFKVNAAIAEAEARLAEGAVDDAYFILLPYSTTVRGDALFKATYQKVLAAKWVIDARKAHQQHAKEKEGGALDEGDVFK